MTKLITTRRAALAGMAGLAALGGRARAAAPAGINVGFFTETKPTMIAKGEGWFDSATKSKITWTEMGSGAEINTAITAGSCDFGLATGSVATAAAIAQGLPLTLIGMVDNIGPAEEMVGPHRRQHQDARRFQGQEARHPVRLDQPFPAARLPEDQRPDRA